MVKLLLKPAISVTILSSCFTLLPSPWKSAMNEAWVPVVPLTPRKRRSSRTLLSARSSISRSWSHRQARFPTVVSWAGLATQ
jgi:hypothetical protein